jgi:copper homeostasis protein
MIQLEICAQSLTSALAAQEGGAHRIELCTALEVGGLTPSYATLIEVRKQLSIDVCVLIRPRAGNFFYNENEFNLIKQDILLCKQLGMEGVVVGMLHEDRTIDLKSMGIMAQLAYPMDIICHRAFDQTPDPFVALEQLKNLGFQRILTSGQAQYAMDGKEILRGLVEVAQDKIDIMLGSGVNIDNIQSLISFTKARTVHTSAKAKMKSAIIDTPEGWRDNDYWETDIEIVKKLVAKLQVI